MKGDKIERTEEIKENQGSKAVRWPAAVIIENALPRTIARAILWNSHIDSLWSPLWPASKPPIRCSSEVPPGAEKNKLCKNLNISKIFCYCIDFQLFKVTLSLWFYAKSIEAVAELS